MIFFDDDNIKPGIVFTEEGDSLLIENDYIFGVERVNSEEDITVPEGVLFTRTFQYTLDGVHWSEWVTLSNFNLSNIVPKYNHIFGIRYKYTREGAGTLSKFHSISLDITYKEIPVPSVYENSYFKKYISYINKEAIGWAVNVLNKVFETGIIPKYITRGGNINWDDEDYINFWWNIIYINALKFSYGNVFSDILGHTSLIKKLLIQKDIIRESEDLGKYYYLLTHYYDEIMKRGSSSIFDKERTLPSNFINVKLTGELLRLCNQPESIESVFGIIPGTETGWVVGETCPGYNYNDFYKDFIKGFELGKSVSDLSLYPLLNEQYITLQEEEVEGEEIDCIKINTTSNLTFAGIKSDYLKGVLVDTGSDYEISFKIKGLKEGNQLLFAIEGYNFLGDLIDFINLVDSEVNNVFLETNSIEGDLFVRAFIRNKDQSEGDTLLYLENVNNLKFVNGIEKISPKILVACENDVFIYDIKIKNLPVTSCASTLLYNSELIIKLLDNYNILSREQIIEKISTKLIPIHMIVSDSERDQEMELIENKYLPYIIPFEL